MSLLKSANPKLLIAGFGVVAICTWGLYAWKFTGNDPYVDSAWMEDEQPQREVISLRATTREPESVTVPPTKPKAEEPLRTVRPNQPASISEEVRTAMRNDEPIPVRPDPQPDASAWRVALASGRAAMKRGDQVAARSAYSQAADRMTGQRGDEIRDELVRMADAMVFSRTAMPGDPLIETHRIAPGESINVIARRFKITDELLIKLNGIENPNRIHAGTRIKVIKGPFDAVVTRSEHRMDIYLQDVLVRSFRVGLGTNNGTPDGNWSVKTKNSNPDWTDPVTNQYFAADNPLNPIGDRWIGLKCVAGDCTGRTGFGIHGTIEPDSIGANMSMGCVRLTADNVAEVYDLLVRQHSRIEIRP